MKTKYPPVLCTQSQREYTARWKITLQGVILINPRANQANRFVSRTAIPLLSSFAIPYLSLLSPANIFASRLIHRLLFALYSRVVHVAPWACSSFGYSAPNKSEDYHSTSKLILYLLWKPTIDTEHWNRTIELEKTLLLLSQKYSIQIKLLA